MSMRKREPKRKMGQTCEQTIHRKEWPNEQQIKTCSNLPGIRQVQVAN